MKLESFHIHNHASLFVKFILRAILKLICFVCTKVHVQINCWAIDYIFLVFVCNEHSVFAVYLLSFNVVNKVFSMFFFVYAKSTQFLSLFVASYACSLTHCFLCQTLFFCLYGLESEVNINFAISFAVKYFSFSLRQHKSICRFTSCKEKLVNSLFNLIPSLWLLVDIA